MHTLKGTLKLFGKPDWRKVLLTIVSTAISFFYVAPGVLEKRGFPIAFLQLKHIPFVGLGGYHTLQSSPLWEQLASWMSERSLIWSGLLIDLLFWYFVSCAFVLTYDGLGQQRPEMSETEMGETVEEQSNPYAKVFLIGISFNAVVAIPLYLTGQAELYFVALAYLSPVLFAIALFLAAALYRTGIDLYPRWLLIGGITFIAGGTVLDVAATILKTPMLELEANPIIRYFLDSGYSVGFVYLYGTVIQVLYVILSCVLWAAFLRHRATLVANALSSRPKSRLEFLKAATGGAHLSWREFLIPLKISEFPKSYYLVWMLPPVLTGINVLRWHMGFVWLGLIELPHTYDLVYYALFISLLMIVTYFVWLLSHFQSTEVTEQAA